MFAALVVNNKQYKVTEDDVLISEKLDGVRRPPPALATRSE